MKVLYIFVGFCLVFSSINAQYFYKDIVSNYESQKLWNLYKTNKITQVQVQSYFADNEQDNEFSILQKNNEAFTQSKTVSKTSNSGELLSIVIYSAQGKVLSNIDSSNENATKTKIGYDEKGRLAQIAVSINQNGIEIESETHVWVYDKDGNPKQMQLIKKNADTTIVKFTVDENGNVTEESHERKGKITTSFFYYYDKDGNITDIVRFNEKVQKLLPDYIFEYQNGVLQKMVQIEAAKNESHTMVFDYDNKGLKIQERMYFKNYKEKLGKLVYIYK